MTIGTGMRQPLGHHAGGVMGDPGLLHKFLKSRPCCRKVVVTVSKRLRQIAPWRDWTPRLLPGQSLILR
jgi:hypothetical protein